MNQKYIAESLLQLPEKIHVIKIDAFGDNIELMLQFAENIDDAVKQTHWWFDHQKTFKRARICGMNGTTIEFIKDKTRTTGADSERGG
ncbi:MAG: hypothetical protein ABR999_10815 [Methanoregula sp.]|jgi:hypothetical protein|uniref:hypothetical protein n=1 Tax=Methanoregula sp. TaxID=2052170 RepID=UPI003D0E00AD